MSVGSAPSTLLGSGDYVFQAEEHWGDLPDGWAYGEVAGVAVDSRDRVYVLNRGAHPIIVYDVNGAFVEAWGEGRFPGRTHAIYIDPNDRIFCVDDQAHVIYQFNTHGELQGMIGTPHQSAKKWSGEPLNLPTDVAVSPLSGDIYVVDGYGNSRVHRYSSEGRLIQSWGHPGNAPGEFAWPHNIRVSGEGYVIVCDRENYRIQIFDQVGHLEDIWYGVFRPCALGLDDRGNVIVGELCPELFLADAPNIGHRVSIFEASGKLLTRIGDALEGTGSGQFIAPHGLALDSLGSIYVGETNWSMRGQYLQPPGELTCLRKLRRVAK